MITDKPFLKPSESAKLNRIDGSESRASMVRLDLAIQAIEDGYSDDEVVKFFGYKDRRSFLNSAMRCRRYSVSKKTFLDTGCHTDYDSADTANTCIWNKMLCSKIPLLKGVQLA